MLLTTHHVYGLKTTATRPAGPVGYRIDNLSLLLVQPSYVPICSLVSLRYVSEYMHVCPYVSQSPL